MQTDGNRFLQEFRSRAQVDCPQWMMDSSLVKEKSDAGSGTRVWAGYISF